jgi:hypothetical protein
MTNTLFWVNIPSIQHDDKIYWKQRTIHIHYNIKPKKTETPYLASLHHSSYKKLEWDRVHRPGGFVCIQHTASLKHNTFLLRMNSTKRSFPNIHYYNGILQMVDNCCSFFWYVQDKWVVFCTLFFLSLSFSHCIVCLSSIYGSWLHLWYHQTFVSSTSYQPFAKYRCSNVCLENFVLYYSFVIEKCCVLKMLYAVYIQTHPAGVPDPILVSCRNYDVEMLNMVFLF